MRITGTSDTRGQHTEEGDEPLRRVLKERLLRLDTLPLEAKLLIGAVVANLFVAACLLVIRNEHLATIRSDSFADTVATVPIVIFAASVLFTSVAWGLVLAGAFRGGWAARLLGLALFFWAQWSVRDITNGVSTTASVAIDSLNGLILVIAVVTWIFERRRRTGGDPDWWEPVRRLLPYLLVLLVSGVYVSAWLGNRAAGQTDNFTDNVAFQISNIQYVLIPLLVLAGSHFGDWGTFITDRLLRRVSRSTAPWAFVGLTLAAAGAILWDGIRIADSESGGGVGPELLLGGLVVVVVAGLFYFGKDRHDWPHHFPFAVLAAAVIFDSTVGYLAEQQFSVTDTLRYAKADGITAIVWLFVGVAALVVLVLLRKKLSTTWVLAGSLIVLIGITDILGAFDVVGTVVHPIGLHSSGTTGHIETNAPYLGIEGLKAWAAMLTIVLALYSASTRQIKRLGPPITALLTLTVSLQILQWVDSIFSRTITASESEALVAGIVLIVALTWEIAASGEGITNRSSRLFPRDSRVLLYSGYILLVAGAALFFSSLHDVKTGHLLESQFDPEQWVREGIVFLGVPLVITLFLLAAQRWRAERPHRDGARTRV